MDSEVFQANLGMGQLMVSSQLTNLGRIRSFLRAVCSSSPVFNSRNDRFDRAMAELELAATELVSNIMRHGFSGRTDGALDIECEVEAGGRVVMTLLHQGKTFTDLTPRPAELLELGEGGMGLYLISQCVDSLSYSVRGDGTNELQLAKTMALS